MSVFTPTHFGHARPAPPEALQPARPQHVAVRPTAIHDGAAPSATSVMACPAQAAGEHLQPLMALSYQRNPLTSLSGVFSLRLSVGNKTAHVAHEPFLALPLLGLELAAAEGWRSEDVSSVRRLRRFSPLMSGRLQPGAQVHCCSILLAFDAREGGVIQYDFGTWHRLADLPDLRLSCVAGAGNFPSERLPLVLPASVLKDFSARLIASGEIPAPVRAE